MAVKRSAHSDASSLEPHSSLQSSASCSMTKNTIPDVVDKGIPQDLLRSGQGRPKDRCERRILDNVVTR